MKERSLVLFTLLMQMAVGAFWTLEMLAFVVSLPPEITRQLTAPILPATGAIVILSLLASFFHLGSPFKGYRAILNVRSSWLSREILFSLLFAASGALFSGCQWFLIAGPGWQTALAWLTGLLGLLLIYCMARLYRLRTTPGWDTPATLVSFLATAFLLGGLFTGVAVSLLDNAPQKFFLPDAGLRALFFRQSINYLVFSGLVSLTVQLVVNVVRYPLVLALEKNVAYEEPRRQPARRRLHILRLSLLVLAGLTILFLLYPAIAAPGKVFVASLAFVFAVASEITGRLLFYETGLRVGV